MGNAETNVARTELLNAAGTGAVVAMVKVTSEFSLPEPTWLGLNPQVASAGSLEHAKVTLLGKDPVVGLTLRVKMAGCPTGADALAGVIPIVKSKFWLGIAVKFTAAEWVMAAGSLPAPLMLKL